MAANDDLDIITTEIKEANWMGIQKTLKLTAVGFAVAGCLFAGYWGGQWQTEGKYDYTSYVDAATIDLAKDMQAICDVRHVCDKKEIIAKFNNIRSEALILNSVEPVGGGK